MNKVQKKWSVEKHLVDLLEIDKEIEMAVCKNWTPKDD